MEQDKHFGFTLDEELHYKLKYIALLEGRSMRGEMLFLLRQYVKEYEEKNGKIKKPE